MVDSGYYMYIEATANHYGEFANMISPPLILSAPGTKVKVIIEMIIFQLLHRYKWTNR